MTGSSIAPHRSRARWAALALIVTAQFMVVLDMSIVNVALASIKSNLDFSQASLQWVITRLRDHLRRLPAARRAPRRRARPPARLPDRHRRVHDRLRTQRPGVVGGLAGRLPRPAGRRWRALRAGRSLAADDRIPGRPRAQPRPRHLGRRLRQRRGGRCAARRRPDLVPELAVGLLHQRARRAGARSSSCRASSPRRRGSSRPATSTSRARRRSPRRSCCSSTR